MLIYILLNTGREEEWTEKEQRCQRDWVKKLWHENPLTKFDDNADYFVCFFKCLQFKFVICQCNKVVWFGLYKKLISDNFNGSDNMYEKFCLKSFSKIH